MIVFLYIGTSLCVYFVYCLNLVKKIVIIIIVIIKNSKCVIVFFVYRTMTDSQMVANP